MSPNPYEIRRLTPGADPEIVRQVARLHQAEIPGGFLSSLGEPFLTQLYGSLLSNPDLFLLAACEGQELLGYLCASKSTGSVYRRFLVRHAWKVMPQLAGRLLTGATVRRVAETLLYPRKTKQSGLPQPEILNFCVSSAHQRRGIGRALMAKLERELSLRGISALRIVTGAGQQSAQRFYESIGARQVQELELHAGTKSLVYVYDLNTPAERAA